DVLTAGAAEALKILSTRDVKLARQAVDLPVWNDLNAERAQLSHLVSSSALLRGPAGDGVRKTIAAMERLESARHAHNTAEALSRVQEAESVLKEVLSQTKGVVDDPTIRNAVYESSYALGVA